MNDPKGSNWRKWDLHVHSPASFIQHYGTDSDETWEAFISDLERLPDEFKVIGINDYIFIDGYRRVLEYRRAGRLKNIDLVLPVIELRVDKFGGTGGELKRVNFHVVFSDEVPPDVIQTQFLNGISTDYQLSPGHNGRPIRWGGMMTPESLIDLGHQIAESVPPKERAKFNDFADVGFNNVNFGLATVRQRLSSHFFEGKHLTAVGKGEWESVRWSEQSIADKRDIINGVDLVFIAANSPEAYAKAKRKLREQHVNDRLLDCSDAHYLSTSSSKSQRVGDSFTWIKADPSFDGLKQALREFDDRVFVGDLPDKLRAVRANPTKYIRSVKITKKSGAKLDELWFDGEIEFNPGLVAVIGNKGNAKSALTDIIGLLGGTKSGDHFSFLHPSKFCQPSNNKAKHFTATLTWESGTTFTKALDEPVQDADVQAVKYIPQNFFEVICNEFAVKERGAFDKELEQVIFSHVDVADRVGKASLRELIDHRTSEINYAIGQLKLELQELNREIIAIETSLHPDYRQAQENNLESKRKELEAHRKTKPAEVLNPAGGTDPAHDAVRTRLDDVRREIEALDGRIEAEKKRQAEFAGVVVSVEKALNKLQNFEAQYRHQKTEFDELRIDGITFDDLVKLDVNRQPLEERRAQAVAGKEAASKLLDPERAESLPAKKDALTKEQSALQNKLAEPDKAYQRYCRALKRWENKEKEIIGGEDVLDSLAYYEGILKKLSKKPAELAGLRARRVELSLKIYAQIQKLAETYRELYAPVQRFIERDELAKRFSLNFDVSIVDREFKERLFEWVRQDVAGSFYGVMSGKKVLGDLLARYDFNKEEDVVSFLNEIIHHLTKDVREKGHEDVKVDSLMKKGKSVDSFYDYVFSIEYLKPRYVLKLGDKEMYQLSPGEKGTLLLVFYLLIDKDDAPLVIDQPEENLDNQTIVDLLVPSIKRAKGRRQIVVVTHNPNLAVVCDAEQVIYASIDKKNQHRVEYRSGAIENPEINKKILDVLEGTRPAFDNRSSKYMPESSQQMGEASRGATSGTSA